MAGTVSGINVANLEEAFAGSEDVLAQMLTLFLTQARERIQQLAGNLADMDEAAARTMLHSLVNISGAVRAYAMSELAKAVGEAVKRQDWNLVQSLARVLERETALVLAQAQVLLDAAQPDPKAMWTARLPGADSEPCSE